MTLNKKTLYIIGGVLLALLLAIIIYFIFANNGKLQNFGFNNINKTSLNQATSSQDQTSAPQLTQTQIFDNYEKQKEILYSKNIDNCATLIEQDEINECVSTMAIDAKKPEDCNRISGDDKLKNECFSSIEYLGASWGDDPNKCSTLRDQPLSDNCFEEYFVKLNNTSQCDTVNDADRKIQCNDMVNKRQAIVFNKPEACSLISGSQMKADCQKVKIVLPLDSDGDGLPDDIEISFGTNPFKADTDGDGLSDYEEINKYHTNPLNTDTDNDGLSDYDEIFKYQSDPLNAGLST